MPLPCQCAQFDSVLEKNWKKGIGQCVFEFRQSRAHFFFAPRGSFMGARGRSRKKKKKDKKLKKNPNPLLRIIPDLCLLQFNDSIQRFKMAVTQRQPVKQVEKVWDNSKPRDKQLCIY
jgi:hypothetical protein